VKKRGEKRESIQKKRKKNETKGSKAIASRRTNLSGLANDHERTAYQTQGTKKMKKKCGVQQIEKVREEATKNHECLGAPPAESQRMHRSKDMKYPGEHDEADQRNTESPDPRPQPGRKGCSSGRGSEKKDLARGRGQRPKAQKRYQQPPAQLKEK